MQNFKHGLLLLSLYVTASFQGTNAESIQWCGKECYDEIWVAFGEVPEKLADVPPQPLFLGFGGRTVLPNGTVNTEQMYDWPNLRW